MTQPDPLSQLMAGAARGLAAKLSIALDTQNAQRVEILRDKAILVMALIEATIPTPRCESDQ